MTVIICAHCTVCLYNYLSRLVLSSQRFSQTWFRSNLSKRKIGLILNLSYSLVRSLWPVSKHSDPLQGNHSTFCRFRKEETVAVWSMLRTSSRNTTEHYLFGVITSRSSWRWMRHQYIADSYYVSRVKYIIIFSTCILKSY